MGRKWASEEQRRIQIVEDRKKARSAKKFQKKAKAHKMQARAQEKQKTLDDISAFMKRNKSDKKNSNEDDLENILSRTGGKERSKDGEEKTGEWWRKQHTPYKKRQALNEKYGRG